MRKKDMLKMEETNEMSNKGKECKDNTAEKHKLLLMRAYVESHDPSSKEEDDLTLIRFLRARDQDVEKVGAMFLKYLDWRRTFLPKGYVSEAEIHHELSQNKVLIGGEDKKGCPIVVVFAGRHCQNSKPRGLDEFKRLIVYTIDKLCKRMPAGQEKFLAISDVQGWGYSNSDIRGYRGALSILQDYYPERLGKLFVLNASKTFMAVGNMIQPFIDDKIKKKIRLVKTKELTSTLLEDIDECQLPDIYGGKLPLVPIQNA